MILSLLVYTILMSTMYCFLLKASKRRLEGGNLFFRKDIIIPIILFAVVMGLRYDVGTDYMNYFDAYVGRSFENERFEVGYRALVWFCHALNFQMFCNKKKQELLLQ